MHNEESITLQINRYGEHLGGISLTYMNTHKCILWFYLRIKIHISAWKWSCYCKVARLNFFWHCSFSFKCAGKWAVWLKICITNIKWQLYAKMTTHFTKIFPLFTACQSLFLYIPSHILICQKKSMKSRKSLQIYDKHTHTHPTELGANTGSLRKSHELHNIRLCTI